LFLGSDKKNLT
jgi:hypothetical protein